MTAPTFALLTGPLNPSLSDFNALINQLNALFPNVATSGNQSVSGNLAVTGTTALTGNTTEAGTLTVTGLTTLNGGIAGGSSANITINTNKFTVAASTGNTVIAGTLAVTGTSAFTGLVAASGNLSVAGNLLYSAANALTAVGTSRANALALTADMNNVTTATSGTGVILPASAVGLLIRIMNNGASPITVYGAGSDTINGTTGATGVALANGAHGTYACTAANVYVST